MKDLVVIGVVMFLMIWIISSSMVVLYQIEMNAYNERTIAFYDKVFAYLLENNQTDLAFNYTPKVPPHDLSEGIL